MTTTAHQKPDNHDAPTILGLRRSALIEIGLFFLVAIAIDSAFLDGTRYWDIAPHPFWFIVVLISSQYGTKEGLIVSIVASLVLLANNIPLQQFSQDRYDYWFSVVQRPLLWSTMAVLLGELRMRHLRERNALRQEVADTRGRETIITNDYHRMQRFKEDLEVRVASQLDTVLTIYEVARAIQKVDPEEVLRGGIQVVSTMMHPNKFSLFLLKNDRLELAIQHGWQATDTYKEIIPSSSALFLNVISKQKMLCSANVDDEHLLGEEGILAGPLMNKESGEILGMLKIERLGFLEFNLTSLQTFKVLCEWIGSTYHNAQSFEHAQSGRMLDDETQLFSRTFFDKQRAILMEMAKRIGFDLSLVVVRLTNKDDLSQDDLNQIPLAINRVWKNILRKTDAACEHSKAGYEFVVILPGTPISDASMVANKISTNLTEELTGTARNAEFSFHTQVLHAEQRLRQFVARDVLTFRQSYLLALAAQADFDLCVLHLDIPDTTQFNSNEIQQIGGSVRRIIETFLRDHEVCSACQLTSVQFKIVLPGVSFKDAENVGSQLVGAALAAETGLKAPIHIVFTVEPLNISVRKKTYESQFA